MPSKNVYIPQDLLDQAREAHRQGIPLAELARKLDTEVEHLSQLLGLPCWRQVPVSNVSELDLWAGEDQL